MMPISIGSASCAAAEALAGEARRGWGRRAFVSGLPRLALRGVMLVLPMAGATLIPVPTHFDTG